ncbi:MAG: DUF2062 domain-containing protein [Deltaproteobacteria bacterium]|jgi:uncharacterized protein (DUF2062 family)|nr:DUF2062 domain-containing protein [Deltaproteobacteria bacterium]
MENDHRFFYRKIVEPVVALIKQGISPERISLGMAGGIILGVFPALGATTILCGLAAIIFRLNLPATQLANYLVYPLQIMLIIPFFHLGGLLFQVEPPPLSAQELITLLRSDLLGTISSYWSATLRAIVAWLLFGLPTFLISHFSLLRLIKTLEFAGTGAKR